MNDMELEELKNSWNALDKRLAESEVVNLRIVKEMIAQKTKSAYDNIYKQNIFSLAVNIVVSGVVASVIYASTPITTISFGIIVVAALLGMIPLVRKITLLSGFDLENKKSNELSRLILKYKKVCQQETPWVILVVGLAMVAFYVSELGFNTNVQYQIGMNILAVIGLTLFTFALAYMVAIWQRRRHAQLMQEIEQGLAEFREFEK